MQLLETIGIITNSQNAKLKSGMASLEEWLQEKYVGIAGIDGETSDKKYQSKLDELLQTYPDWFFKNENYDYVTVEYNSTDSSGNPDTKYLKVRLIKKKNLDKDVQSQLVGGDAGNDNLLSYLQFKDVYGVTNDLKVFYCSNGISSLVGADIGDSDIIDSSLVIYQKRKSGFKFVL